MYNKKLIALLAVFLIIIYGSFKITPFSKAASPSDDDQISSDLSLDLDLAQKDPAPAQQQIVQSQVSQAKIVTDKGEQAVVTVKDEVPAEVKLQPAKDVVHEQTTSEEVVNKNVEEKTSQNNNGDLNNVVKPSVSSSPDSKDKIPGTDIDEPDDNGASPLPSSSVNSSVNPSAQPSETPQNPGTSSNSQTTGGDQINPTSIPSTSSTENPIQPQNTSSPNLDTMQSANVQPTGSPAQPDTKQPTTTNTIPPENGVAPAPKEESQPAPNQNETGPASGSNDSGNSNSSGSESSGGDSSAVQGVSTGPSIPLWQQLISKIIGALK